jgi:SAM-dependent methyltransferase
VVAVDLSRAALKECSRLAREAGVADERLDAVAADATALPFAGASFDAVTTRSVLMYVPDRPRAIHELQRVLKPEGRASLYEAIDREWVAPNIRIDEPALAPVAEAHERVVSHMQARARFREEIASFTVDNLTRDLGEAGFVSIDLTVERHLNEAYRATEWEARTFVTTQPHPGTPSYEEAAQQVIGAAAAEHLRRFEDLLVEQPFQLAWAVVYVSARKR